MVTGGDTGAVATTVPTVSSTVFVTVPTVWSTVPTVFATVSSAVRVTVPALCFTVSSAAFTAVSAEFFTCLTVRGSVDVAFRTWERTVAVPPRTEGAAGAFAADAEMATTAAESPAGAAAESAPAVDASVGCAWRRDFRPT
jgi:hypothetical protein